MKLFKNIILEQKALLIVASLFMKTLISHSHWLVIVILYSKCKVGVNFIVSMELKEGNVSKKCFNSLPGRDIMVMLSITIIAFYKLQLLCRFVKCCILTEYKHF